MVSNLTLLMNIYYSFDCVVIIVSFSLDEMKETLLLTPYAKVVDSEHINIRCPICGDSQKHKDGAHCGIWIKEGQPLIYHCWICEDSGIVDTNFMNLLDIDNNELMNQVNLYNKASMKRKDNSFKIYKEDRIYNFPQISDTENHRAKLGYMIDRLGVPFTYETIEALRIVFSLEDYLTLNKVRWNPKYKKSMYYLNRDYIGFVSTTKDLVNLRCIQADPKIRYIKYPLYENQVGSEQMYVIPTMADMFNPEIDLHLAEGPFDILGVLFHVRKANIRNQIYAAIGGSGYQKAIRYFLRKGFLTNMNLWIYSDSDKSIHFYDRLIKRYRSWLKSIHIIYNTYKGEKDFGVPKSRIKPKEYKLGDV